MPHLDEGQLHALLDGELEADERVTLESHLKACTACSELLEEARAFMVESDDLVRSLDVPPRSASPWPLGSESPVEVGGGRRLSRYRRLAWAASVVLAAGLGYYASDYRRVREAPARTTTTSGLAPETAMPMANAAAIVTDTPAAATPKPVREADATKALATRAEEPASPPADLRAYRTDAPPVPPAQEPARPAGRDSQARQAAKVAAPAESVTAGTLADLSSARLEEQEGRARIEPLSSDRVVSVQPSPPGIAPAPVARAGAASTALNRAVDPGRRVITMDQAVRRLSGTIRLIDGLTPERVELRQGNGPVAESIRVVYLDPPGRELWLDQQRPAPANEVEGYAASAAESVQPGDTLVQSEAIGGRTRLLWLDAVGFHLSLSAYLDVDSLRALARRVR